LEINDSHILMYLDGLADLELQKEIENDPDYQLRTQELRNWQNRFSAQLFRATCLDPLVLGEYHLDTLSSPEKKMVKEHLAECPHCTHELDEISNFLQLSLIERVIARWVSGGVTDNQPQWIPSYGLRGGEVGPYVYEAGEVQIAIDIQDDNEHPARKAIIGLISGAPVEDYEVSIWFEGIRTATAQVDDLNYFKIADLARGEYELLIRGPKVEIQVQRFIIS